MFQESTSRAIFRGATFVVMVCLLGFLGVGCSDGSGSLDSGGDGETTTHSIAGQVSGDVVAGVAVLLSNDAKTIANTDENGVYHFNDLVDGTYTVTPLLAGHSFTPNTQLVTISGGDKSDVDFTSELVPESYTIAGKVTGEVVHGVAITLSGGNAGTTITDANGAYSFQGLRDAFYTVTPELAGCNFTPLEHNLVVSGSDKTQVSFSSMAAPYSISGSVSGDVIQGVTITLHGDGWARTITDANGTFSFSGLVDGSYYIVPRLNAFSFEPIEYEVTVSGTDEEGVYFSSIAAPTYAEWPDDRVLSISYDSDYTTPADFYQEDKEHGYPYYENTISTGLDDSHWFELCTNDRDQAYAWSESSGIRGGYSRELESEIETEKYFEFRRLSEVNPNAVSLSRVHKCSYLDRSMYDRRNPTRLLGEFQIRPITSESVRELAEYMWASGMIEIFSKVLSSETTETPDDFCQTILYTIKVGGDWGVHDVIHLYEAEIFVNKQSGKVTCGTTELRSIQGNYNP